ncbi:unnamed protein product [Schistocephalus solidus]|uniref:Uncharacterized protein n=1 Tax=Schistocephalus solidus TaxID=70667 RepID=A0A183ST67_SCHSO|nr:unnamed protein product [Schistocephalus solidus]
MGIFGHMRIHDSRIHHNADNTDTSCTPSAPGILTATATPTSMNDIPQPLPISLAYTAPATSIQASAWSVTCESIARRLVAAPSQLHLPQHGVDAEVSGPLQDFRVWDHVLPSQLQYSAEAAEMEVIKIPGLVREDGPGLHSVKE